MPSILLDFLIWLQAAGTAPGAGGGGGGGGSPLSGDGGMGCAMQAGLFGVMMIVFYFFLLRPERKRREEHEEMISSLRKGTKVRTSGGMLGEVVTVTDDELVLQIADRVRVNVLRANVSTVESVRKESKAADDKKTASDTKTDAKADKKKSSKKDDAEAQDGA